MEQKKIINIIPIKTTFYNFLCCSGRYLSHSKIFTASIGRLKCFIVFISILIITVSFCHPVFAAMIKCHHCKKSVDEVNTVCPYCLGDLNVPAVDMTGENAQNSDVVRGSGAQNTFSNSKKNKISSGYNREGQSETLITEQQLTLYFQNFILKRFSEKYPCHKVTIEKIKRDNSDPVKFFLTGTAFSRENKPMSVLAYFIDALHDTETIDRADLNHASKIDIENPSLINYVITLKIFPESKELKKFVRSKQPLDFTFVVPPSRSENVNVKILQINADSERVLYNMNNKAGDKVSLDLIPEGGMKVIVLIDEKKVYEKNY